MVRDADVPSLPSPLPLTLLPFPPLPPLFWGGVVNCNSLCGGIESIFFRGLACCVWRAKGLPVRMIDGVAFPSVYGGLVRRDAPLLDPSIKVDCTNLVFRGNFSQCDFQKWWGVYPPRAPPLPPPFLDPPSRRSFSPSLCLACFDSELEGPEVGALEVQPRQEARVEPSGEGEERGAPPSSADAHERVDRPPTLTRETGEGRDAGEGSVSCVGEPEWRFLRRPLIHHPSSIIHARTVVAAIWVQIDFDKPTRLLYRVEWSTVGVGFAQACQAVSPPCYPHFL